MRSRHIVVHITHEATDREPDLGLEGLRAAVGLARATEGHEIDVLLDEGGVQWLNGKCSAEARAMLAQLRSADVCWYAAKDAVETHKVGEAIEGITTVDAEARQALIDGADVVLRY